MLERRHVQAILRPKALKLAGIRIPLIVSLVQFFADANFVFLVDMQGR